MSEIDTHSIPPEVRAAMKQFLNASSGSGGLFAVSEALEAIRRVFPELDVSDDRLMNALTSEASVAGFDIDYDAEQQPKTLKRRALERWDNEGGAIGQPSRAKQAR
jgi:hypothetical protein